MLKFPQNCHLSQAFAFISKHLFNPKKWQILYQEQETKLYIRNYSLNVLTVPAMALSSGATMGKKKGKILLSLKYQSSWGVCVYKLSNKVTSLLQVVIMSLKETECCENVYQNIIYKIICTFSLCEGAIKEDI